MASRRNFIRLAGGAGVVVAASAGGFALTRDPSDALKPWSTAGKGYDDPRKKALSYAILAPNPHNRQPWIADLRTADTVDLYCDTARVLPETDPFNRQIIIGLGCFLELLKIAATADGYDVTIAAFPDGAPGRTVDNRRIARATFRKRGGVTADSLFAHVLTRRSNKTPYDTRRAVPTADLQALRDAGKPFAPTKTVADAEKIAAMRDLTFKAHMIEVTTPRTYMESVRLMRLGKSEINASPDGIDIGGFFPEAMMLLGVLTRKTLADQTSTAFSEGMKMYKDIMMSAMAYTWIETPDNSRLSQLAAGRAWIRINLTATARGVALHPVSQALQEFREMAGPYRKVHQLLEVASGGRIQMLGRVGFASRPGPSPRWPLTTRLKNA